MKITCPFSVSLVYPPHIAADTLGQWFSAVFCTLGSSGGFQSCQSPHWRFRLNRSGVGTCALMFLKFLGDLTCSQVENHIIRYSDLVYTTSNHFSKTWPHHITIPEDSDCSRHRTILYSATRFIFEGIKEVNRSIKSKSIQSLLLILQISEKKIKIKIEYQLC